MNERARRRVVLSPPLFFNNRPKEKVMAYGFDKFEKEVCQILADFIGLQVEHIRNALVVAEQNLYRRHVIPKRRGGTRVIHEPCEELKVVQGALLEYFHKNFVLDRRFFGCVPGKSPVDNARYHIWYEDGEPFLPEAIFHVDLKDAFPSVTEEMLRSLWSKMYSTKKFLQFTNESMELAEIMRQKFINLLTYLTAHNGCLPQGAATSPYLLNLVISHQGLLKKIDASLKNRSFRVSIYVDDIAISIPRSNAWYTSRSSMSWRFRKKVVRLIKSCGFEINSNKTRYNEKSRKAHRVTGISLALDSQGKPRLSLPQKTRNTWRGHLHQATLALEEGREPDIAEDGVSLPQAHGIAGWIQEVYEGFDLPGDIGIPLADFKIAYARYKANKQRW